jgi:hypothetical protein
LLEFHDPILDGAHEVMDEIDLTSRDQNWSGARDAGASKVNGKVEVWKWSSRVMEKSQE